ncbi:ABC transporter substrate-binding protein [Gordonia bronchialis]|uniref:ABC transporter substrate-binding protein n=1 Tax=Gordonia bronchialis TaxID=2054 RepID=UPI00226F6941|nr:ABC transporter substrate-binding protein [Gordonia bronchialis]
MRFRRAVAVVALIVAATMLAACAEDDTLRTPDGRPISTSTTRIAEVNLVTPERDFSKTCLQPTAPDAGQPDVTRIVVTDPALLDAVCALGIGPKVVAVTAAPGSVMTYLGPQLTSVPAIGTTPDAAAVADAKPDVILTSPATASSATAFAGVRTVSVAPGTWQEQFQAVADGLGRSESGVRLLKQFTTRATNAGRWADAAHTWVSLVRFTDDEMEQIAGNSTFAGQILAMMGAQRPPSQRGAESFTVTDKNFRDADGDLIYVSFQGPKGLDHGKQVLLSDRWLDLGAPTWKRVLAVDDDVWYGTSGLAAAWLVLYDVRGSLADGSSANY